MHTSLLSSVPVALRRPAGLAVALAAALSGCTDALVTPASNLPAGITVVFQANPASQPAAGTNGPGEAFDRADAVRIRVTRSAPDLPAFEATLPLGTATGGQRRVGPISLPMRQSPEQVELSLELLRGQDVLFRGNPEGNVELRSGQTTSVPISPIAVPGGVQVPESLPDLTSLGETVQLTGRVTFATGDEIPGLTLTWSTQNPEIVEVSPQGQLVSRAEGTAVVTGSFGDFSGSLNVRVNPLVATITLQPAAPQLPVGGTVQLVASLRDARGNLLANRTVESWTSSSDAIATVDGNGLVRGVAPGTATITATSQGRSAMAEVTVSGGSGILYGTVQDLQSQAAVAGAAVTLTNLGSGAALEQTTDASGRYRFEGLAAATYRLNITASGYTTQQVSTVTVRQLPGGDRVRIDVALPLASFNRPVGGFAGRVTTPAGEPIAGATVMVSGGEQTNGVFMSTQTASDGTYSLVGVVLVDANGNPIQAFAVIASSPGRRTVSRGGLTVPDGQILGNLDFTLEPGPSVDVFFEDGFEGPLAWTTGGLWNRTTGAGIQNQAVPTYVRLAPDDNTQGFLPSAAQGSHYMWFGSPQTGPQRGNFMGQQEPGDPPGSGGTSVQRQSGTLTSPVFLIPAGAERATLEFTTWFEIESVNPNSSGFDLMDVSVQDVATGAVTQLMRLNPFVDPTLPDREMIPFTSGGFNRAPVYRPVAVSLDALRGRQVRLRFTFDTEDELYNGFRGWIVDDVRVSNAAIATSPASQPATGVQSQGQRQGQCTAGTSACRPRGRTRSP